jgi:hypothetical protein
VYRRSLAMRGGLLASDPRDVNAVGRVAFVESQLGEGPACARRDRRSARPSSSRHSAFSSERGRRTTLTRQIRQGHGPILRCWKPFAVKLVRLVKPLRGHLSLYREVSERARVLSEEGREDPFDRKRRAAAAACGIAGGAEWLQNHDPRLRRSSCNSSRPPEKKSPGFAPMTSAPKTSASAGLCADMYVDPQSSVRGGCRSKGIRMTPTRIEDRGASRPLHSRSF